MSALFTLDLETTGDRRATLRLGDEDGRNLDAWEFDLDQHPLSRRDALFDTRRRVRRMRNVEAPDEVLADLERFLGAHVLGPGSLRGSPRGTGSGRRSSGFRIRRATRSLRHLRACPGRSPALRGMR